MEPSEKAPGMERFLEAQFGRTTAITNNRCVRPPVGCGSPVTEESFRAPINLQEYKISGLCQKCQDEAFREPEE